MIRYQGESIDFSITLNEAGGITKWSDFDSLVLYLYTDELHKTRFSAAVEVVTLVGKGELRNFISDTLTMSTDGKTISGTLLSADTLTMKGTLYFDVLGRKGTTKVYIRSQNTNTRIEYAPIKAELQ